MFFNLTWRNAKRSRSENLIYFLTMITAVAMFYIVLSLGQQDVIRFLSEIESDAVERLLTNLLPTVYLCALLFVFFLVVFANKYQLECRSRELGLYLMFGMTKITIPITISIKKSNKADVVFHSFLLEPDDTNEYLLCEIVPALLRPYVRELGQHLRTQQEYVNEQKIKISDYEQYIENWAHEIKKPLSLMTLLLDNRKNEMSPLVHTRMLYVRDHARQDVEQILYFSRLGAVHKDYYFEPLSILRTCREAVEDNVTLLEEAGFSIEFWGMNIKLYPTKKG